MKEKFFVKTYSVVDLRAKVCGKQTDNRSKRIRFVYCLQNVREGTELARACVLKNSYSGPILASILINYMIIVIVFSK